MKPKFVLYDIDGTLISMKSGFMPGLINELLSRLGRTETFISDVSFAGRTDRDIFSKLIALNQLDSSSFDELKQVYLDVLNEMLAPEHLDTHSGAADSIEFTGRTGHTAGLLTGNFEQAAYTKLNRAGLDHYFSTGAFGGEHHERNKLPEVAFEKGRELIGSSLEPSDMIIIGDTPNDIKCAQHFGCVSVAVSTGSYTQPELAKYKPDYLIDSLAYPENWLAGILNS